MSLFRSIHNRERSIKPRRLSAEPLEARRVLAASLGWDGPGLGGAELSYYVANSPDSLSLAETTAAIETALAAWSSAADITFTPTNQAGLRDSIDIAFTNIDGVGGTLAQAYFPDDVNSARIAGDIQFDISDAWEVGNSAGNRAFDLVYVAVHEIGHSLGLDHTGVLSSVLTPSVSASQSFSSLEAVDVAAIQGLYAPADPAATIETPVDEAPANEIPTDEAPVDVAPTDVVDESVDPVDGVDDPETPVDEVNESDEEDCQDDGQHPAGILNVGLLHRDAETFITRFDTDEDAALSEDEVSVRLWAMLTEMEVDTDADGLVTLAELDAASTAARHEAFDEMDADSDGLLVESEVSDRFWNQLSAADADATISFDEFDAFLTEHRTGHRTEMTGRGGRQHHHRASDAVFTSIGRGGNLEFSRSRR